MTGILRIDTNPTGATVNVNNNTMGVTPLDIKDVIPGQYIVKLDLKGFLNYNIKVSVLDKKVLKIVYDFTQRKVDSQYLDIPVQTTHVQPSGQQLPSTQETPVGTSTETSILAQHLADMNRILDNIKEYIGKTAGFDVNEKYYSTQQLAITVATPNKPDNADVIANAVTGAIGYDRIPVYDIMHRSSRSISVINDGTAHLFVITSSDGKNFSAQENPILVGESRIFHNIYEMRIRSPSSGDLTTGVGGLYRVTEYDYSLSYSISGSINRVSFVARIVNSPLAGAFLPDISVPGGFALTLRANVNNGLGFVYIADTILNATNAAVPGFRITLAAGDVARLYITNANLVAVAGSTGAENIELLVEI